MQKIFSVFALLALSGSAFAADMATRAPPPPPPAAFSWTGIYIGGNLGYSLGRSDTNNIFSDGILGVVTPNSNSANLTGAIGGIEAGFNWQPNVPWVLGLEADWQYSGEKGGLSNSSSYTIPIIGTAGTVAMSYDSKIQWLGTVRERIGYAWGPVLVYGTGGLAYGQVKIDGTTTDSGFSIPFGSYAVSAPISASRFNTGWTVGGGIEGAFASNLSWKVEYLYVDLGSLLFFGVGPFPFNPGAVVTVQAKFTDNIVRAGLNLQFH